MPTKPIGICNLKSNKKDKKQIPDDEKIIWKNNPFVNPKGEFKKLSEEE